MDLNHLHHREGEERIRADNAACPKSRAAHLDLANLYRDRIDFRRRTALDKAGLVPALRSPVL